jgi:DMSO/TMAO reductase YedYZ molybdopterin-dependent catalytic subunit
LKSRRAFLRAMGGLAGLGAMILTPVGSMLRFATAEVRKRILPKGTDRNTLVTQDPASLDPRNLDLTPLKDFGTMGLSDHQVDLSKWRLKVEGDVSTPLRLAYEQVLAMPEIEREVLLICPGVFANYGRWKGLSLKTLMKRADARKCVTHVTFYGPEGEYQKTERFTLDEVMTDKVFLAHRVNGETLPVQNGFPLRLVAEDHYGYEWVKYVDKVSFDSPESGR